MTVRQTAEALERPASTYATYENEYKKEFLPLDLIKSLIPIFLPRGVPAEKLLALAGVTAAEGTPLVAAFEENAQQLNPAPLIKTADWPRDLPVYGVAIGGSEGGIEFNGQVTDYVKRPPRLQAVRDAYAVYVHGDSMSPWRKNGELIIVHPGLPCRIGDYVVVQLRPEHPGDAPKAYIKELVRRTEKDLRLRQFNPAKEITIPMAKVLAVHRVLDWTELLEG